MSNVIDDQIFHYQRELNSLTNLGLVSTSINAQNFQNGGNGVVASNTSYVSPVLNAMVSFALWEIEIEQNAQLIKDLETYIKSLSGDDSYDLGTVDGIIAQQTDQDMRQLEALANSLSDAQKVAAEDIL